MRCETGEFPIKIIQGDSYRRVYKFYDADGNLMDNDTILSVVLSVSRLNYTQILNWSADAEGYVFILSAETTSNFPYCKGAYDVTLNFVDHQVSTQVYQSSWQVFEKDVFYNTLTHNKGYMTCEDSEVVIKTGLMITTGGIDDHSQLINRNLPNQHPMGAITGLEEALEGKQPIGDYATTQEVDELANIVDSKANASDIPTKTSDLTNDSGFTTKTYVDGIDTNLQGQIDDLQAEKMPLTEIDTTPTEGSTNLVESGGVYDVVENIQTSLQEQIDVIVSSSDVKDVVGTYAELQSYDTSTLGNNDIVKVLNDSTHNNARSYYRWVISGNIGSWVYVGSEAISYTKSEADALLAQKQNVIADLTTIRSGAAKGATAVQTSAEIEAMLAQDVELVYGGFSTEDVIDALYNGKEAPNTYAQKSDFVDIPYADLGATPYTYSEIVAGHNNGKRYRVLTPHNNDIVICPLTNIGINSRSPLLHFATIESIDMSPNVRQWDLKIVTLDNNNEKHNFTDVVPIDARGTEIVDAGHYYTSNNVEGALAEIGDTLDGLKEDLALKADKDEIPTALPNPHKLTINGTEYDGSADVQMTIQGGGGESYDDTELRQRIGAIEAKESGWDAKSDFSGNYNDLTNKPTIPTVPQNVSAFTNDSGYLTLATLPVYGGEVV